MTLDANGISTFRLILTIIRKIIEDLLQKTGPNFIPKRNKHCFFVLSSGSYVVSCIWKIL
jgi:hypothetical protein